MQNKRFSQSPKKPGLTTTPWNDQEFQQVENTLFSVFSSTSRHSLNTKQLASVNCNKV